MSDPSSSEEELQINMHNRIRNFLMDFDGLKTRENGITLDLKGGKRYCFPYPAIDWENFSLSGHSAMYYRQLSRENNWKSCIEFRSPQDASISVKDHNRYYCLMLSRPEDVPEDFSAYFSSMSSDLIVPILVPLIDLDKSELDEDGEQLYLNGRGQFALYGPPNDMGYLSVENNAEKVKDAVLSNADRMGNFGIQSIKTGNFSTAMFPTTVELSLEFTYEITVNMQEDHYWNTNY